MAFPAQVALFVGRGGLGVLLGPPEDSIPEMIEVTSLPA
jgi:hypothetical protein